MSQSAPSPLGGPPRDAGGSPQEAGTQDPSRQDPSRHDPGQDPETAAGLEDLQRQIRTTRAELGATVAALSAKTDVAARAQDRATRLVGRVRDSDLVTRVRRGELGDLVTRVRRGEFGDLVREAPVVQRAREADLRGIADRGVQGVRRHPLPVAAGLAAMLTAVVLSLRARRDRRTTAGRRTVRSRRGRGRR